MVIKILTGGILLLSLTLWIGLPKYMTTKKSDDLIITTQGLEELGITLQAPYGSRSFHHALIINNGPHHVLACDVLFEVVAKNGEVSSGHKVVFSHALAEEDPAERRAFLMKEPAIAPHTKWLVGLGVDPALEPVGDTPPPLADDAILPDVKNYKQLNITLKAVVIEDGRAFGSNAQGFLKHLNEELLREEERRE